MNITASMQGYKNNPAQQFGQLSTPPQSRLLVKGLGLILLGLTLTACGGGSGGGSSAGTSGSAGIDPNDIDGDNITNAADIDADGDGLIELRTAAELNSIRYNLRGTGLDTAATDSTTDDNVAGCGGGQDATGNNITSCIGYELMANIDLNDLVDDATTSHSWDPIGRCNDLDCENTNQHFAATFNGNNYTISNMRINITAAGADSQNQTFGFGFFGAVAANSQLRNIHIRQGYISTVSGVSARRVGSLVGLAGANVSVTGSSVILDSISGGTAITDGDVIGGLVGLAGAGTSVTGSSVILDSINGSSTIGGLVGSASAGVSITDSSVILDSISGVIWIGGLIGFGNDNIQLSSSYVMLRKLQASNSNVGSLIGQVNSAIITHSYAVVGELLADGRSDDVGGLVGSHSSQSMELRIRYSFAVFANMSGSGGNYGGLVGRSELLNMKYSYAVFNQIMANNQTGGLTGFGESANITSSYALANQLSSDGGNGGLVGVRFESEIPNQLPTSYYNITTINNPSSTSLGAPFGVSYSRAELSAPTDFTSPSIYATWANGHCNPTTGEYMEVEPATPPPGFMPVWNLDDGDENTGDTADANKGADYPALNCLPNFTPAQQRVAIDMALQGLSPISAHPDAQSVRQ